VFLSKNKLRNLSAIILIIFGIVGITIAILTTPGFATKYLSADHNLTLGGIKKLTYYRYFSTLFGIFLIISGSILMTIKDFNSKLHRILGFYRNDVLNEKKITKMRAVIIFSLLASIYYLIWVLKADIQDTAFFGGDTWEYQSMGVNFAKGHGLQKFGAMESFDSYKFEIPNPLPVYYDRFILEAGRDNFFRTPAYPLFLGMVYKVFGVSPKIAKDFQLLMLVIIAASLPFIGYHYWGKLGFLGGIPAGFLYLAMNFKLAEEIMTEPLISLAVFFVILALLFYEGQQRMTTAILLGFSFGFGLLVKGTLIFLPILTFCLMFLRIMIEKNLDGLKRLLVVIFATLLTFLPWSIYASVKSGGLIFLTTQGSYEILDANNELCIDGMWHHEWSENKAAFYNNDGIDNSHVLEKVINFYWHHPSLFPRCMYAKFMRGFGPLPFLWIFTALLLLGGILRMINHWLKSEFIYGLKGLSLKQIPASFWMVAGNFLLVTLIYYGVEGIVPSRYVAPMDFLFALLCCVSAVIFLSNIISNMHKLSGGMKNRPPERLTRISE
jgi:hypothetical protein